MPPKVKHYFATPLLFVFSIFISLTISEVLLRTLIDPVDYLEAYLMDDNILGHRVSPRSSGHDAWGFRNPFVPASAQIVAIGDSQTYGISASARNSWPLRLGRLRNENAYNLSLGGYGPVQYYRLLTNQAFKLAPSVVVVGFYFGNDLFDAYEMVYKNDYWRSFRRADFPVGETRSPARSSPTRQRKFLGSLRNWLAHHSIAYRMFSFSFGNTFRFVEMKYGTAQSTNDIVIIDDKKLPIRTGLTPSARLSGLNLNDIRIREGLRLTLSMFQRMNDLCAEKNIDFLVVLIPTKESVFADYIHYNGDGKEVNELYQVVANERQVNQLSRSYFDKHGISYLDVLPPLKAAVGTKTLYPSNADGHPNADGYQVIAEAVHNGLIHLQQRKAGRSVALINPFIN